ECSRRKPSAAIPRAPRCSSRRARPASIPPRSRASTWPADAARCGTTSPCRRSTSAAWATSPPLPCSVRGACWTPGPRAPSARAEISDHDQRPAEYTFVVLAAALREGWKGPVFLQGDHFQINAKKYAGDPKSELNAVKQLTVEAIQSGFYNIDVDTSTLVDLS